MLDLERAVDLLILHRINFERYSAGVVNRILAQLNKADAELFSRLSLLLEDAPASLSAQAEYLTGMLASVRGLNAQAYEAIERTMRVEIQAAADTEAAWNNRLYSAMSRQPLSVVTAEQVYAAALSRPFQGTLLREAFPELGEARMRRMRDAIRMGFATGKPGQEIVRELRGTKAKGYVEGFVEIDRRHLETVVRTALSHTAATARDRWEEENADAIESVLWLATLDGKTSNPCRLRDHKRYSKDTHRPIGHGYPWGAGPGRYHYNCRSVSLALLPGQTELYGARASKDGPTDANESYSDWIKRQPRQVQEEVLGATRAKLMRDGGLTLERFSTERGEWLDLGELKRRDAAAFKRAGL